MSIFFIFLNLKKLDREIVGLARFCIACEGTHTNNRRVETALGVNTFKDNDAFLLSFLTICEFFWFLGKFVDYFSSSV
jgi:hypothetical protein